MKRWVKSLSGKSVISLVSEWVTKMVTERGYALAIAYGCRVVALRPVAVRALRRMAHARQTNYLIWLRTGAITSPGPTGAIGGRGNHSLLLPRNLNRSRRCFLLGLPR